MRKETALSLLSRLQPISLAASLILLLCLDWFFLAIVSLTTFLTFCALIFAFLNTLSAFLASSSAFLAAASLAAASIFACSAAYLAFCALIYASLSLASSFFFYSSAYLLN